MTDLCTQTPGQIDFEAVPGFLPEPRSDTAREYPCGCRFAAPGDVSSYCPEHDMHLVMDTAQVAMRAEFERAVESIVRLGIAVSCLLAGWILAKIF